MNFKAYTDLSPPHIIIVRGQDAMTFLQGQLTCDLKDCQAGSTIRGAYCNIQGRVIGNFLLFQHQDQYYLIFAEPIAAAFLEFLKKYAMFSKVSFELAPSSLHLFGVWGDEGDLPDLKIPITPTRCLILTEKNELPLPLQPTSAWQLLDINSGLANITVQTQGLFLPHELQYPDLGLINLKKGCYLGQEIIARMHFRGKSKYSLYRFETAVPLAAVPGEAIHQGRIVNLLQLDSSTVGLVSLLHTSERLISIKGVKTQIQQVSASSEF